MKFGFLTLSASLLCVGLQANAQGSVNEFDKVVAKQFQLLNSKINELLKLDLAASPGPIMKVLVNDKYYYMDAKFKYLDLIPATVVMGSQYKICNGFMPAKTEQGEGKKAQAFPKTTDKRECSDSREDWNPYGQRYNSKLAPENRVEVIEWMSTLTSPKQAAQMAEMIAVRLGITKDRAPLYKLDSVSIESLGYSSDTSAYSVDFWVRQKNTGNMINLHSTKKCKAVISVVIEAEGPMVEMDGMSCVTTTEIPPR